MKRYIAFDVETPNTMHRRICQVGLSVMEDGHILDSRSILVNPETSYSYVNTMIHGITEEDTMFSPAFPRVWETIGPILKSGIVVAHNAAFDMGVLRATLQSYEIYELPLPCIDTLRMARRCIRDSRNHKLNTLCDYFGIPLNHHDAGSDSRACALLLDAMIRRGEDPASYIKLYPMFD